MQRIFFIYCAINYSMTATFDCFCLSLIAVRAQFVARVSQSHPSPATPTG